MYLCQNACMFTRGVRVAPRAALFVLCVISPDTVKYGDATQIDAFALALALALNDFLPRQRRRLYRPPCPVQR
jgi:hypothetical protein